MKRTRFIWIVKLRHDDTGEEVNEVVSSYWDPEHVLTGEGVESAATIQIRMRTRKVIPLVVISKALQPA